MQAATDLNLQLTLKAHLISEFYPLLQRGVWLPVITGDNVMKLLNNQLGIAEAYVTDRITTLFLDGKAIDDAAASIVKDGSTLALSSAMPGLVGSTMRRGGHLAAMRGEITYHPTQTATIGAGKVKIKLFNMLMQEVGPLLLERGVLLSGAELITLLDEGASSFRDGCDSFALNSQLYPCAELGGKLLTTLAPQQTVLLKVVWKD
ncbi:MAG: hypothetical protein K0A94_00820 [Desulfuromonadales bacterium]|nr:hypothetical protein [Desulfuromonadales bacterium]